MAAEVKRVKAQCKVLEKEMEELRRSEAEARAAAIEAGEKPKAAVNKKLVAYPHLPWH